MIKFLSYFLYYTIGYHFPKSNAKLHLFSKQIRRFFAKGFIKQCGRKVNIQRHVVLPKDFTIGDYSGVGANSVIGSGTIIGNNVMMGPECYIYTSNHKHDNTDIPMIKQGYEDVKPVIIADDVWIGSRVTILPGVHIGKGSIIGASAVVTKDVPEYSVCCGNPAQVVKNRKKELQ